jgi:hypothetical protein
VGEEPGDGVLGLVLVGKKLEEGVVGFLDGCDVKSEDHAWRDGRTKVVALLKMSIARRWDSAMAV